jgi:hypothetical protein
MAVVSFVSSSLPSNGYTCYILNGSLYNLQLRIYFSIVLHSSLVTVIFPLYPINHRVTASMKKAENCTLPHSACVRVAFVTADETLSDMPSDDVAVAKDGFCSCDTVSTKDADSFFTCNTMSRCWWKILPEFVFLTDFALFESFTFITLRLLFKVLSNQKQNKTDGNNNLMWSNNSAILRCHTFALQRI